MSCVISISLSKIKFHIKERSLIAQVAAWKLGAPRVAIVVGRTIHLHNATRADLLQNPRWLRHELQHILQYRRYGWFFFLCRYLWQSLRRGYYNNKYEAEARHAETDETITDLFELKNVKTA
jgi:hypothetical protein